MKQKKVEQNKAEVAINVSFFDFVYVDTGKLEIKPSYISKRNLEKVKRAILLIVADGEKCHYLAVTRSFTLLKEVTSKQNDIMKVLQLELFMFILNRKQT